MNKMSTFAQLSLVAQYDDVCRLMNKMIKDHQTQTDEFIIYVEESQRRCKARIAENKELKAQRDRTVAEIMELRTKITSLQKESKKDKRLLQECRAALARKDEENKVHAREKKALANQIKQIRQLVLNTDNLEIAEAHKKRFIQYLDVDRLSPIHSDNDDSDDCVSGLDYDKTEDEIIDESERPRRDAAVLGALEDLPNKDLPGIPTLDNHSNGTGSDYGSDIENVRQLLNQYEREKKEKLNSGLSTPNVRTLAARSTADLMKTVSNLSTPVPNTQKAHQFSNKKSFKPDTCGPCGGKITFYGAVCKCEHCGIVCHPQCKEDCPLPCVKITAPNTRSRSKKILISDYVSINACPKVPAIIIHCCNEIERDDKIVIENLYRSVASTQEIEELQHKILKSKSGMPSLTNVNVHLLTGVVKRFLQGLDESLITSTLWSQFASASQEESITEAKSLMTYYIKSDLPTANRDTLAFMMLHLHAIAKHSDKNLMPKENLVKTLAPTIVGNSCTNLAHEEIKKENKIQIKVMETLFELGEEFWEQFVPKAPKAQRPLGSRLLAATPSSNGPKTRSSHLRSGTLPTPKMKSLFS